MSKIICIADAIARHSLNDGLVSRWKALPDQQRGVVFRDLCMRHHGTLTSGPVWEGAKGRPGGCGSLSFDGSDDYVTTAVGSVPAMGGTSPFTLSVWVKTQTTDVAVFAVPDGGQGAGSYDKVLFISGFFGTNVVRLSTVGGDVYGNTSVTDNVWHHLAATFDGTTGAVYVDGKQQNTGALGSSYTAASPTWVWSFFRSGINPFNGLMDDFRIHNIALSAAEIAVLYHATRQQYDPTLNWRQTRRYAPEPIAGGATGNPWHYYRQIAG